MPEFTRNWKKQGMVSPLECFETAWHCQHLEFRILASRTMAEYVSVVVSHLVRGNLFQQSQETNTLALPMVQNANVLYFYECPK